MGVSGIVQALPAVIFSLYWKNLSREATMIVFIVGLIVTFTAYGVGQAFGMYEGFLGLFVNVVLVCLLNPLFAGKAKERNNPVMKTIFGNGE